MIDFPGIGSLATSVLTFLETRKQRKLLEQMVRPARPPARRRRRRTKRKPSPTAEAARVAAEQRRQQRLQLDREKHEWNKKRDVAKLVGWVFERISDDEDQDYEHE